MTNLGMKIVGEELEVGFTVASREDFDQTIARLQVVASLLWPASLAAQRGVGDDEPIPEPNDKGVNWSQQANYAEERAAAQAWRENQGLR